MTFIESFTLMLALIYSICVLYTSGKKLGSMITSGIVIIAVLERSLLASAHCSVISGGCYLFRFLL